MKPPLEVRRHGSATSFLRRAEEWLIGYQPLCDVSDYDF
jgi:hypothetical protein